MIRSVLVTSCFRLFVFLTLPLTTKGITSVRPDIEIMGYVRKRMVLVAEDSVSRIHSKELETQFS